MKVHFLLIILPLFIILSCSSTMNISNVGNLKFESITEASYSAKRIGEMNRKEALELKVSRKEFYNSKGILVEYLQYETDGSIYEKTVLRKNEDDKLLESKTYDKEGNLKRYVITEFDEAGNIIVYNTFNPENELISVQTNDYDSKGNITLMTRTNTITNKTFRTVNKYDSENRLIEKTEFTSDGLVKDIRTYKYDDRGNEFASDLSRPNGAYTKFESKYDENNNLITQVWYDKSGTQIHQTSFSYVYDKENNWITKKRYSKGELGYVWERTIEYN